MGQWQVWVFKESNTESSEWQYWVLRHRKLRWNLRRRNFIPFLPRQGRNYNVLTFIIEATGQLSRNVCFKTQTTLIMRLIYLALWRYVAPRTFDVVQPRDVFDADEAADVLTSEEGRHVAVQQNLELFRSTHPSVSKSTPQIVSNCFNLLTLNLVLSLVRSFLVNASLKACADKLLR